MVRRDDRRVADLFHRFVHVFGPGALPVEDAYLRASVGAAPAVFAPAFFVYDQAARFAGVGGVGRFDFPLADAADVLGGALGRDELDRAPAFLTLPASADQLLRHPQ